MSRLGTCIDVLISPVHINMPPSLPLYISPTCISDALTDDWSIGSLYPKLIEPKLLKTFWTWEKFNTSVFLACETNCCNKPLCNFCTSSYFSSPLFILNVIAPVTLSSKYGIFNDADLPFNIKL